MFDIEPVIYAKEPAKVKLEAGTEYYFCSCGRAADGIFCDGSHKGTPFKPVIYTPEKTDEYWICRCKHSKNMPFCDGTHETL